MVKPIPDGYHAVTPYLLVRNVPDFIEFLKAAFDAQEIERIGTPETMMHAEVRIGDSIIMMGEARDPWPPMPTCLYLYVPDADATYAKAIAAGATSIMPPADQFYGDRNGGVRDAAGNLWWIATHKEDVSPEELGRRHEEFARSKRQG